MNTKILLLAGLVLVIMVSEAHATVYRENLKGLPGVIVSIAPLSPDLEKDGAVTTGQLQTRVEAKLRQTGIKIFSVTEGTTPPDTPVLLLEVNTVKTATGGSSVVVDLSMHEKVTLRRVGDSIAHAITWRCYVVGFAGTTHVQGIYDFENSVLNEFSNDYQAANPK